MPGLTQLPRRAGQNCDVIVVCGKWWKDPINVIVFMVIVFVSILIVIGLLVYWNRRADDSPRLAVVLRPATRASRPRQLLAPPL